MKKERKLLALLLVSIFVILLSTTAIVSALDIATQTAQQAAGGAAKGVTSEAKTIFEKIWGTSSFELTDATKGTVSKLLLMVLLVMLVYSVMSFLPIVNEEWIKWVIAIIVSILSFIFVSVDNIKYIAANYEAMGIIMTSVLPLIIVVAFAMKFRQAAWTKQDAFSAAMSGAIVKIIIFGFIVYAGARWYMLTFVETTTSLQIPELVWMYPICLVIGIIFFFTEQRLFLRAKRAEKILQRRRAASVLQGAVAHERMENAALKATGAPEESWMNFSKEELDKALKE